jgi:hypothetical protein
MKPIISEEPSDYDCEQDADTLIEAAEIRNDPERFADAKKELADRKKSINSIEDLKDLANKNDEDEED